MRKSRISRKISNTLYNLGVATLIASLVWLGVGIYNATTKEPDINVAKEDLEPISTNVDMEFLEEIAKREQLAKNVDSYLEAELGGEQVEAEQEEEVVEEEEASPAAEQASEPVEESSPAAETSPVGESEQ